MYFDNPANNGQVHLAWSDAYATSIEKNDELVTLRFRALNDSDIQTSLSIVESNKSTVVVAEGVELLEKEIITNIKNLKSEIKLYQNQPNPFTDQTMIQFDLPGSEMVTIDILDISGKQIYHLSASFPKGVNQLVIDADEIPNAGIYYYRMTAGDFVETKKLIYIKN